jgi:hypothetical protein
VVDFEVAAGVAADDDAFASSDDHRGAKVGGDVASEVRDARDIAALLDDRGDERVPEYLADPRDVDRSDPGNLARLAGTHIAAHECGMVDHDVNGRCGSFRSRPVHVSVAFEDQADECVGGVGLVRLVLTGGAVFTEDPLYFCVEHGFHLAAELGGELEVSFEHPVGRGPGPQPTRRAVTFRTLLGVLAFGACVYARFLQRDEALVRRGEQLLFRGRVHGGGFGDQLRLASRQPSRTHRRIGLRQLLELLRGADRATRLTRIRAERTADELRRVTIVLTVPAVRGCALDAPRGLAEHSVDEPADHSQLADHAHCFFASEHARLELSGQRFEFGSGGAQCVEHLFVLYWTPTTFKAKIANDFRALPVVVDPQTARLTESVLEVLGWRSEQNRCRE